MQTGVANPTLMPSGPPAVAPGSEVKESAEALPVTERRMPQLLGDAGVGVLRRAFVEAGIQRIIDVLAVDEVDHHRRGAIAHLERALPDLNMAASGLERLDLWRQHVAGDDDEPLLWSLSMTWSVTCAYACGANCAQPPTSTNASRSGWAVKVSAICWLARSAWSLV